jgi:hypothetical protein
MPVQGPHVSPDDSHGLPGQLMLEVEVLRR